MPIISRFLFCCLSAFVFLSCQSAPLKANAGDTLRDRLALSPREDVEAEQMGLFYSGEIVAPEDVYQSITNGLKKLRNDIPDSLRELRDIRFLPYIIYGRIQLLMTAEARDSMRQRDYVEWDSLNEFLGSELIDTTYRNYSIPNGERFFATMKSVPLTSSYLMGKLYEELDGIVDARTIRMLEPFIVDTSTLFYGSQNSRNFFLVSKRWGDCPAGCMYTHYYLFEEIEGHYLLKHDWLADFRYDVPEWFTRAKKSILINRSVDNIADIPQYLRPGL